MVKKKKRKKANRQSTASVSYKPDYGVSPSCFSMPTDFQTEPRSACLSQADEKLIQLPEMPISDSFPLAVLSGVSGWLVVVIVLVVVVTQRRQKDGDPVVMAC